MQKIVRVNMAVIESRRMLRRLSCRCKQPRSMRACATSNAAIGKVRISGTTYLVRDIKGVAHLSAQSGDKQSSSHVGRQPSETMAALARKEIKLGSDFAESIGSLLPIRSARISLFMQVDLSRGTAIELLVSGGRCRVRPKTFKFHADDRKSSMHFALISTAAIKNGPAFSDQSLDSATADNVPMKRPLASAQRNTARVALLLHLQTERGRRHAYAFAIFPSSPSLVCMSSTDWTSYRGALDPADLATVRRRLFKCARSGTAGVVASYDRTRRLGCYWQLNHKSLSTLLRISRAGPPQTAMFWP